VRFRVNLSDRAARDLDRLGREVQQRMLRRLDQLAENPRDPRTSAPLTNRGNLRKSRVGGWRIIFTADDSERLLNVITIERRGQVYQRI
jgi:mRNA-degrading endonuclease RelE of RelBE toxin-antitoxin system